MEEGAWSLTSGRLCRRRVETDGGDASWRSAENPVGRRISQICEEVKAECLLEFQNFGVRHFGNPDDKELGHFALKTPKSRNATCPWSKVVVPEEAAILAFRYFRVREIEGPRTICSRNYEIANSEIPKKVERGRVDFGISGPGWSRGQESGDVES
jgi:hypothetical protein